MKSRQRIQRLLIAAVSVLAVLTMARTKMARAKPAGGSISGRVTYTGTPAKMKVIDMSKEPACAKQHPQSITTETVVTDASNSLENVVVYISAGAPDEPAPTKSAVFDQKGCQYLPHVLAFQVNQPLEIVNSDPVAHNIHPRPMLNREWNKSQPAGSPPDVEKYDKAEFFPVKCNIHPWMSGHFAVLKNSHYSISNQDGAFSIPNLPPGKYTVTAWQEAYGNQTMDVTITAGESKTVDFVFKATPYVY